MKLLNLSLLNILIALQAFGQPSQLVSKSELIADVDYLYASLKEAHYDLYAYTAKAAYDAFYNEVKNEIRKDSFNLLEATSILQKVASKANNGHTNIGFPVQPYIEYGDSGGTLFPLEIAFQDFKPLVRKNWSDDKEIAIGSELVSINGMPIQEILDKIYPLISAERLYFKNTKIEFFSFPRYYWQAFGKVDSFEVELSKNGTLKKHQIKAIRVFEEYHAQREEVFNASMKLELLKNAAYLNPGNLSGEKEVYQHFFDSTFAAINEAKVKNLIIDLRNNQGGDDAFSDYFVSYFADKPFHWCADFTLKTSGFLKEHVRANFDTTSGFWQSALTHEDGEIYTYDFDAYQPQPQEKRFHGDVYVLVNRQSHSQAAVAAAQMQDYQFATIVGEETGDYPSLYASVFYFKLPNTGITVQVSKGYLVRVNGSTKEEGVIPDIVIEDYLLDEHDEILDGLLEILDEKVSH